MKFRQLLGEKYYQSFTLGDKYVEVFKNHSKKEFDDLKKRNNTGFVRMLVTDSSNPVIYTWRGDVLHNEFSKKTKIGFGDFKFRWDKDTYGGDPHLQSDSSIVAELENKEEVLKTIKKFFPREKYILDRSRNIYDLTTGKKKK